MKTTITQAERLQLVELLTQAERPAQIEQGIFHNVFELLGATSAEREIATIASLRPQAKQVDRMLEMLGITVEVAS